MHVACGNEQVVVGAGADVRGAVFLEHDADRLLETAEVKRTIGHLGVGRHRPRASRRVECGSERREPGDREEGNVEHRG